MRPILLVPGYSGSGPDHWQTHWQKAYPSAVRVEQADWEDPDREAWVSALDAAVARAPGPPVLVAHSLGCWVVVDWALRQPRPVAGALLVAPPDLERPDAASVLTRFGPVPLQSLPFRSILAASTDDPYLGLTTARRFAEAWGSRLESLGPAGHVNTEAGFGPWPEGEHLLKELLAARPKPRHRPIPGNAGYSRLHT